MQNLKPFLANPDWFSQRVIKTTVRCRYPSPWGERAGMKEHFLRRFTVTGGQSRTQTLRSPVQVEGCNLRVVPLKVREVEEVNGGLLVPGLPGRRGEGGGHGHGRSHPECGLGSKPPLTLCPWYYWRHSQTQSSPVAPCWVVWSQIPQPGAHTPPAPNPRAGKPSWTGGSSWTIFFFPPLEVTTPSQAAPSLPQAPPGKARRRGPTCSPQFWGRGAEARQQTKRFSLRSLLQLHLTT